MELVVKKVEESIMKSIKSIVQRAGKLWLIGACISALFGLIHGILTVYGVIQWGIV